MALDPPDARERGLLKAFASTVLHALARMS